MKALDTSVLVRYIVRDEPRQAAAATRAVEAACSARTPGVVTLVVMCELVWVLERGYRFGRARVAAVLRGILGAQDLRVERSELAWQALNRYEDGPGDYADYVIGLCGREEGAEVTVTFDRRAAGSPLFEVVGARS